MISFLDNLNQSQLPRALGYLLKLACADIFYKQPFPSRHPPFPVSIPLFLSSCLSPSISTSCLLERSFSPDVYKLGFIHCPRSLVTEQNLLNEIIYVPTPCRRQAHECYLSSLPFVKMPWLKMLSVKWSAHILRHVFVSISFSLTIFAETDNVPINAKSLTLDNRGVGGKRPDDYNQLMKTIF